MNAPPPGAVVLSITGIQGPADAAAVQAALLRCDPAARLWTDWPQGLVAMETAAPAAMLRAAVQTAGYGVFQRSGPGAPRGSVGGIFGRMLLYAVLGAVLGLAAGVVLGLANSMLNPDCTRPGSSGGCAIGVGLFGMLFGALGVPAGAVAGLIHGIARRTG
ncbi:hypothetical protein KPL78_03925 [Roseomonas sp. HJA6]|uniref:Uncharacterized protein n=1 Tax=Roseomonas alba TaxID=2846776 RepID=A0ABS7A6P7_9PROT|nr:hypothetical protein [Neoroseomonas alba]MBW6396980.1 hypothetical protein [Neoroseomonas alba]